jgi:hypothetical protein
VRESILTLGWGEWAAGLLADDSAAFAPGWADFTTMFVEKIAGHPARGDQDRRRGHCPRRFG